MALLNGYKYHLFLDRPIEQTGLEWYDEQRDRLQVCYNAAYSITMMPEGYKSLVDDSNFIICFWAGNKQGQTYSAIRYALSVGKLVLNGLDELKLITNKDIG